jgi:hypothetical protein
MPGEDEERKSAALKLAEEIQRRPFAAAAIAAGGAAAAAGAVMGARALARRNGARQGKPVNQVLAAAITACEAKAACNPDGAAVEEGPPVGIGD